MKKFLVTMGFALALFGCDEANDVFDYEDYGWDHSIQVGNNYYEGPVYLDATSWGAAAYVDEKYVNKGVKLLVSQNDDAEGGMEYDVNSQVVAVNDLSLNTMYYYCLKISNADIKSEIKSTYTGEVSKLSMTLVDSLEINSLVCHLGDTVNPVFIVEKGFKFGNDEDGVKFQIAPEQDFIASKEDIMKQLSINGYIWAYAYLQTSNGYYVSDGKDVGISGASTSDKVNSTQIVFSEITETADEYLVCTITGYTDKVYFKCSDWQWSEQLIEPTKFEAKEDGSVTYYLKKDFYRSVELVADYKMYYEWDPENYGEFTSNSNAYYITEFSISSLDDFLKFAQLDIYETCTVHLKTNITLPSDTRLSLALGSITLEGNNNVIDGISYFPFIREMSSSAIIKNLKIGTDKTIYNVKKGTNSLSTTNNEVPRYLLTDGFSGTFDNCEIRGTIKVFDRDDFYVTYDYRYYSEDTDSSSTDMEYIEKKAGLRDYTTTEFITTNSN